jgi:hypothetical protein
MSGFGRILRLPSSQLSVTLLAQPISLGSRSWLYVIGRTVH